MNNMLIGFCLFHAMLIVEMSGNFGRGGLFDVEFFLGEVGVTPFLYDRNDKRYRNLKLKEIAWRRIAECCNLKSEDAKKKWKNLLDTYRKEKKIIDEKIESCASANEQYVCKWKWFPQMDAIMHGNAQEFQHTTSNLIPVVEADFPVEDELSRFPVECTVEDISSESALLIHAGHAHNSDDISVDTNEDKQSMLNEEPSPIRRKRRQVQDSECECISNLTKKIINKIEQEDEMYHYSMSLAHRLRKLPSQQQTEARFKIEEVLYNISKQ